MKHKYQRFIISTSIYIDVTSHGTLEFLAIKKIRTSSIPNHKNLPL